jgi:hypothetical protein
VWTDVDVVATATAGVGAAAVDAGAAAVDIVITLHSICTALFTSILYLDPCLD